MKMQNCCLPFFRTNLFDCYYFPEKQKNNNNQLKKKNDFYTFAVYFFSVWFNSQTAFAKWFSLFSLISFFDN